MKTSTEMQQRIPLLSLGESHTQPSRLVDPLAYSLEFENALLSKISVFQATLDQVAIQLQSTQQRRLLTRLEHNMLGMAWLAFDQAHGYGLTSDQRNSVAAAFLMEAALKALKMIVRGSSASNCRATAGLAAILKSLGTPPSELNACSQFLSWDNPQNLSDFLDFSCLDEVRLKAGNAARKLHYICQLSLFTSTPKSPDDYPISVLVTPEELFSLSTMWARKPLLWTRNAAVTDSGKLLITRVHADNQIIQRRDLGPLSELHLKMARLIRQNCR